MLDWELEIDEHHQISKWTLLSFSYIHRIAISCIPEINKVSSTRLFDSTQDHV